MNISDNAGEFSFILSVCIGVLTAGYTTWKSLLVWLVVFEIVVVVYCTTNGEEWTWQARALVVVGYVVGFLLGKQLVGWHTYSVTDWR